MDTPYVVMDIETTGLSRYFHSITEIAAIKVADGVIMDEFSTLINPGHPIPRFITQLTGITDGMVRHMPMLGNVLPHLMDFLEGYPIVAHNASFDHGFISYHAKRLLNKEVSNKTICTCKLAYRLLPTLQNRKLGTICRHFGIVNSSAHRAMGDVRATHEVFLSFLELLKQREIENAKSIFSFQKMPRKLISEANAARCSPGDCRCATGPQIP